MIIVWIILAGVVILLLALAGIYNNLVQLKNRVRNAWAQIDVQLKRRYDLIPNLVEVAKGYLKHEREVLENVTHARNLGLAAKGPQEAANADNFLTQTLKSLFAVVENYPDLKANQNMLKLQEELTTTENKISFARQYYNDETMRYNTAIQSFPTNIIAALFNFRGEELFQIQQDSERQTPKVNF